MRSRLLHIILLTVLLGAVAASPATARPCLKPGALKASPHGAAALQVTWRAPRGAARRTAYRVWRSGEVVGQTRKRRMVVRVVPGRAIIIAVGVVRSHGRAPACRSRIRATRRSGSAASLATPQHLVVSGVSETAATLSWGAVSGATAYRVRRDGRVLRQSVRPELRAPITAARAYAFDVIAVDAHGRQSRPSRTLEVRSSHRPPLAPTGIGVTRATTDAIGLRWSSARAGSGVVSGYRVWRDGAVVGQPTTTSLRLSPLAAGRSYEVEVAAVDAQGYMGARSAAVSVVTQAPARGQGQRTWAFLLASTDSSFEAFEANYRQVGTVIPTYFDCDRTTLAVQGRDDPRITAFARQRGIPVTPRFNCQGTQLAHQLLTDEPTRAATIDALAALVRRHGYQGINLDIEAGAPGDRNALSSFTAELADRLHAVGGTLSIDVSPKFADVRNHPRSTFFDYEALSRSADTVIVMSWGLHWTTSGPGPVADLRWFNKVYDYVATLPNHDRFVVGQPMYGMDWPGGGGPGRPATPLGWDALQALITRTGATPVLDQPSGELHFSYADDAGVVHDVWFQDAARLQEHMAVAGRHGLGGVALWRLGQEDPAVWRTTPLGGPGL